VAEPSMGIGNRVTTDPTILVVEDEILIRMWLADELREAGYRVIETISADEALAVLRGGTYVDLTLTDVQMPGSMDGHALAHAIRSEFPGNKNCGSIGSRIRCHQCSRCEFCKAL
jgi:CheY-like chemotaxis protein